MSVFPRFYHFRLRSSKGIARGGVAVHVDLVNGDTLQFATAVCSPQDTYCKKLGRRIAEGRAKAGVLTHSTPLVIESAPVFEQAKVVAETAWGRVNQNFSREWLASVSADCEPELVSLGKPVEKK